MNHIDVMKQALEYLQDNQHLIADNERHAYVMEYNAFVERFEQTIAEAEKQQALDKKADNARELGLSYEQPAQQEPSAEQLRQIIKGLERCHVPGSKAEFLRVWIRDWTAHKLDTPTPPAPAQEPVIQDWMKPDALCDRSCLYACTEGFTKFPICVPPTTPAQEPCKYCGGTKGHWEGCKAPIEPAQQEPDPDELTIAYMSGLHEGKKRKPWVGLTDEEIAQGLKESWVTEQAWQSAVWWAEAKLKEKNTKGGA